MSSNIDPVSITILGKVYQISCLPEDRDSLTHSAKLLDQRLNDQRNNAGLPHDQAYMMAGLSLASDYLKAKGRLEQLERQMIEGSEKLLKLLNEAKKEK